MEHDLNSKDPFALASQLYDDGDYKRAFGQFLSLANEGDTSAMTRVALMYGEGQGVARDVDESIRWDMRAAESGDTVGMLNLGITYLTKGDTTSAALWFEKAMDAGDGEAALELAKMHLVDGNDHARIKRYLALAAGDANLSEASSQEVKRLLDELKA